MEGLTSSLGYVEQSEAEFIAASQAGQEVLSDAP
jgi:hypothetical protein